MFCPVVAEDDGSIAEVFVFGDFADDRGGIIVFPVEGVNVPLDGVIIDFFTYIDQVIVIIAVGRAEKLHIFSGELFDFFVGGEDFRFAFFGTKCRHLLVVFAVVAEVVSGSSDRFYIIRIFLDPSACHEKSDPDIVVFKDF